MDIEKYSKRIRLPLAWVASILATVFTAGGTIAFAKANQATTEHRVTKVEARTERLEDRTEQDRLEAVKVRTALEILVKSVGRIERKLDERR